MEDRELTDLIVFFVQNIKTVDPRQLAVVVTILQEIKDDITLHQNIRDDTSYRIPLSAHKK